MEKVLLVSLSYPPLKNPQSIRWRILSDFLRKKGLDLDILTIDFALSSGSGSLNAANVKRLWSPVTSFLINNFLKVGDGIKRSYWRRLLLNLYELFSLGDAFLDWGIRVSIELLKIERMYRKIIISCEPHIATFLPALFLRNSKFILDLADPPLSNYFLGKSLFPYNKLHNWIFYLALKRAAKVVFTGFGVRKFFLEKFPFLKEKSFVVTQGFFREVFEVSSYNHRIGNPPLLTFAGNFIKKIREPLPLVRALSKLNVKFIYIGKEDSWSPLFRRSLGSRYISLGRLPHSEVLKYQLMSDILVYLGNTVAYQQSGKIYEYLGANRPILAIVQNKNDDAIRLLRGLDNGVICANREEDILRAVYRLLSTLRARKPSRDVYRLNFCWDALAGKYMQIILES